MRELISGTDPDGDGNVLWLKGGVYPNEHASQVAFIELADDDEGAITAANQRGGFHVAPENTGTLDLPGKGLRFATNLVAGVTNGTIAAYTTVSMAYMDGI